MSGEPYPYHPNWNAFIYPTAGRSAWQCPGCKTWHAPHADKYGRVLGLLWFEGDPQTVNNQMLAFTNAQWLKLGGKPT